MARCACTAGTEANDWHQDWCDDCRAEELRQWSDCMASFAKASETMMPEFVKAGDNG